MKWSSRHRIVISGTASLFAQACACMLALVAHANPARGEANAAIETSSFFRTASERPTNGSALVLQGHFQGETRWFDAVADAKLNALMLGGLVLAPEAHEAYLQTNDSLSAHHRVA